MVCVLTSVWVVVLVDVGEGVASAGASAWAVVLVGVGEGVGDAVGTGEGVGDGDGAILGGGVGVGCGVGGGGCTVGLFSTFRTTFTVRGLFKSAVPLSFAVSEI